MQLRKNIVLIFFISINLIFYFKNLEMYIVMGFFQ